MTALRNCGDCGIYPGGLHSPGCDMERCPLCGGQIISCNCIYELAGMPMDRLAIDQPHIYNSGPTPLMEATFEAAIAANGGPLPWNGEYGGSAECREFGFYSYWGQGTWVRCEATHPNARPDLNRLHTDAKWDRPSRKWVLK